MEKPEEINKSVLNRNSPEDLKGRKTNKNNVIIVTGIFLFLFIVSAVVIGYFFLSVSDYDKGANLYKDKRFSEALTEFQKVNPDNKNFVNAQSRINYINGLFAFNENKKMEAIVYLSKVRTDDENYQDARMMLGKLDEASDGNDRQSQIDALSDKKDTVIIRKEYTSTPKKVKEPVDPKIIADLEISRKFISDAGNSISRFESLYQSARTAPLKTKSDYGKGLESVNKEFNNIKYTAQNRDAGVVELRRLTGEWMSKRIAFIRQLINDKSVSETELSRALKEEGDRLYTEVVSKMDQVKKYI